MTVTEQNLLSRLGDPAVVANPYPVLAALREASPYATMDGALIVAGRHAHCSRILRDPRLSSERSTSRLAFTDCARATTLRPDSARASPISCSRVVFPVPVEPTTRAVRCMGSLLLETEIGAATAA